MYDPTISQIRPEVMRKLKRLEEKYGPAREEDSLSLSQQYQQVEEEYATQPASRFRIPFLRPSSRPDMRQPSTPSHDYEHSSPGVRRRNKNSEDLIQYLNFSVPSVVSTDFEKETQSNQSGETKTDSTQHQSQDDRSEGHCQDVMVLRTSCFQPHTLRNSVSRPLENHQSHNSQTSPRHGDLKDSVPQRNCSEMHCQDVEVQRKGSHQPSQGEIKRQNIRKRIEQLRSTGRLKSQQSTQDNNRVSPVAQNNPSPEQVSYEEIEDIEEIEDTEDTYRQKFSSITSTELEIMKMLSKIDEVLQSDSQIIEEMVTSNPSGIKNVLHHLKSVCRSKVNGIHSLLNHIKVILNK